MKQFFKNKFYLSQVIYFFAVNIFLYFFCVRLQKLLYLCVRKFMIKT